MAAARFVDENDAAMSEFTQSAQVIVKAADGPDIPIVYDVFGSYEPLYSPFQTDVRPKWA
jgi:hypothetical protein